MEIEVWIIFLVKKKEGILLNLCDNLECGIFGICGVVSLDDYDIIIPELVVDHNCVVVCSKMTAAAGVILRQNLEPGFYRYQYVFN